MNEGACDELEIMLTFSSCLSVSEKSEHGEKAKKRDRWNFKREWCFKYNAIALRSKDFLIFDTNSSSSARWNRVNSCFEQIALHLLENRYSMSISHLINVCCA